VRLAIGDGEQRINKTVPRRGYLFAAAVSEAAVDVEGTASANAVNRAPVDPGAAPQSTTDVAEHPSMQNRRRWIIFGAATLLMVAIGAAAWILRPQTGLPLSDRPSIAVLPFINMGSDPGQEYFCDGITDDLTGLSRFSELFVIARDSAFTYKGKHIETMQVERDLGVRYLLHGSVRRDGEQLRITAQLVDTNTGNRSGRIITTARLAASSPFKTR
jgi:TolB-like protein